MLLKLGKEDGNSAEEVFLALDEGEGRLRGGQSCLDN